MLTIYCAAIEVQYPGVLDLSMYNSLLRLSILREFTPSISHINMASRLSRAAFARLARPAARVGGRTVTRRGMSSSSGSQGSDMLWMIGSALVFGPAALYLLSPSAQHKAHEAQQHALPKTKESKPENVPVPDGPAPQESAPEEPKTDESSATTDDEGTSASSEEVTDSINKAVDEDAPKNAHAAEEGQKQESEETPAPEPMEEPKKVEPKQETDAGDINNKPEVPGPGEKKAEKPGDEEAKQRSGTLQGKEDAGPSNVGDARAQSKSGNDPKDAKAE